MFAALRPLAEDPAVLGLYERLDELEEARVDDPRIAPLAAELVAAVPDEVLAVLPAGNRPPPGSGGCCSTTTRPRSARWCAG